MKIAFHIYQKNSYIYQFVPTTATFFQYHPNIIEHRTALRLKVEFFEVAVFIGYKAGYFIGARLAWAHARQEQ
jgi:hypothetical protein